MDKQTNIILKTIYQKAQNFLEPLGAILGIIIIDHPKESGPT